MAAFRADDIVAIVRLNPDLHGCPGRHPKPGETGRVRHVIEDNGYLTWLCDFDERDLELRIRPDAGDGI
jgi:hypothetical protein